jgi:hypothetical protein
MEPSMQSLPEPLRRFAPFIGVALLLVVGYLAYGKLTGGGGGHEAEAEAEAHAGAAAPSALDLEQAAEEKQDRRDDEVAGPLVTLGEPFVVNLGDQGLHTTVRVAVAIQVDEGTPVVADAEGGPAHLAEEILARDIVLDAIGGLTSANLLAPAARDDVRALLLRRLNRGLPATLALEAYFTELTVENAAPGARAVDLEAKADEGADDEEAKESEDEPAAEAEEHAAEADEEHATEPEAEAEEAEEPAHADEPAEATSVEHGDKADPAAEARAQAKAQVEEEQAQEQEADSGDDAEPADDAEHETTEEH